uniref:Uncharacterized protein n=1 Tax=Myotis myotis TaxID=51298 RepID=A0A7J7VHW6_MYOMY|nr:hypothetical protein mMyoMyo1_008271 [Myotis myotis]
MAIPEQASARAGGPQVGLLLGSPWRSQSRQVWRAAGPQVRLLLGSPWQSQNKKVPHRQHPAGPAPCLCSDPVIHEQESAACRQHPTLATAQGREKHAVEARSLRDQHRGAPAPSLHGVAGGRPPADTHTHTHTHSACSEPPMQLGAGPQQTHTHTHAHAHAHRHTHRTPAPSLCCQTVAVSRTYTEGSRTVSGAGWAEGTPPPTPTLSA